MYKRKLEKLEKRSKALRQTKKHGDHRTMGLQTTMQQGPHSKQISHGMKNQANHMTMNMQTIRHQGPHSKQHSMENKGNNITMDVQTRKQGPHSKQHSHGTENQTNHITMGMQTTRQHGSHSKQQKTKTGENDESYII